MKKIITVLALFGLFIGLVGCSLPTEEVYTEETKKEVVVEEEFKYEITKGGWSQLNDYLIFTYYIDANKPFTLVCSKKFTINGREVNIYVSFPRSLTPNKNQIETFRPSFKVIEASKKEKEYFTVKTTRMFYHLEDYWPEQRDMKFTYVFIISTGGKNWKVVWNKDVEYRIEGSSIYIDVYVPYDTVLEPEVFDFYAPSFDTFTIVEVK